MKAMWIAFAATVVISLLAWLGLGLLGFDAATQGSTGGGAVRLD